MAKSTSQTPQSISEHQLEWNDQLQDWLDGDSESAEFEQHLSTCDICQEQLAEMQSLDASLMAASPKPTLSASFDARLFEQIETLDESRRAAARQRVEQERQRDLAALSRSWRRTLAFVLPGILGGIALAFALAASLDASGITTKLAQQGAIELGANAGVIQFLLTAILGAALGGVMAGWFSRAGE
ncbi:MAG: anti-sigma factor family protein [Povalibacter sp.]